jgi:hypothetical protein
MKFGCVGIDSLFLTSELDKSECQIHGPADFSFFHWLYSPLESSPLIFSFMIILQIVGPLGQ